MYEQELPDNIIISTYNKSNNRIPNFKPDLCLNIFGEIDLIKNSSRQFWIKTDNLDLINFIKDNSLKKYLKGKSIPCLNILILKRILLENFYKTDSPNGE